MFTDIRYGFAFTGVLVSDNSGEGSLAKERKPSHICVIS